MKKLTSIMLVLVLFLCPLALSSCKEAENDEATLTIVTTVFPAYDFARQITSGMSEVSLTMLLPPGSESHDFEPSLANLDILGRAQLVICVGGESDEWIDKALEVSGSEAAVVRMTDCVALLEAGHTGEHHHEHGHEDTEYDEHVWTSPSNAALITEAVCDALEGISPDNETLFRENCASYAEKLSALEAEIHSLRDLPQKKTLIFADRFPFRYLLDLIGADYTAAFEGCSSDSEIPLATLYFLTEEAKRTGSRVVLISEFASDVAAGVIADEAGATVMRLHSCHNVSREDFDLGVTYVDLMKENLKVLREALT